VEAAKNEKTEKQKENWLSWKQVEEKRAELSGEADKIKGTTATPAQFDVLLQNLVLSLYTDVQPRRNQDYLDMYIVKKWSDKLPQDKNYLDLTNKKFVYHKYKTAKKYGTQTLEIPDSLMESINKYLKYHPLWKGAAKRSAIPVKLLVGADGTPLAAVNAITRILNRIFGKKVGSSMLRHIYISDKYGDLIEEQKDDAAAMGHSVALQREYYKKEDDDSGDEETIKHA
jgi:integrase